MWLAFIALEAIHHDQHHCTRRKRLKDIESTNAQPYAHLRQLPNLWEGSLLEFLSPVMRLRIGGIVFA
jgi:hypothetical protein